MTVADRFAEGATTKNVNTMALFLTLAGGTDVIQRIYRGWKTWGRMGDE